MKKAYGIKINGKLQAEAYKKRGYALGVVFKRQYLKKVEVVKVRIAEIK